MFACLALRPKMHAVEYPYLKNVVDSGVPFSIISAGTDLPLSKNCDVYSGFSNETLELLSEIDSKAKIFTTRGVLSQELCRRLGLRNVKFSGDVAFYDNSLDNRSFKEGVEIKNIVISDPHYAKFYLNSLGLLIGGMSEIFPEANIVLAQHGVSKEVERYCEEKGVNICKIYENKDNGLDLYDDADLHVGFRVHGHVSALKRRKYSYLIEQDGRGADYGLTICRKLSVPGYFSGFPEASFKNFVKLMLGRHVNRKINAPLSPVYQVLALINSDQEDSFKRFVGLECQILSFNNALRSCVDDALSNSC
jgi:hypothetical protein